MKGVGRPISAMESCFQENFVNPPFSICATEFDFEFKILFVGLFLYFCHTGPFSLRTVKTIAPQLCPFDLDGSLDLFHSFVLMIPTLCSKTNKKQEGCLLSNAIFFIAGVLQGNPTTDKENQP